MGIWSGIVKGFQAVAAVFGWAQQRDAEENSPEMQAAAAAKTAAAAKAQANSDVTSGNLAQEQKDVS